MGAMIILVFIFLAGISLGVVFTLIALSSRRTIAEHPPIDPPLVSDSSNPYEPSSVQFVRPSRPLNGCAIAIAVLGIVGISLLTFAALLFFARTSSVKTAPPPVNGPATAPVLLPPTSSI
jgi:hypothetical protein